MLHHFNLCYLSLNMTYTLFDIQSAGGPVLALSVDVLHGYFLITDMFQLDLR